MKRKKILIIFLIVLAVILIAPIILNGIAWTYIFGYTIINGIMNMWEEKPQPAVTYGEFPIELTYEVNSEVITVSDVYICKFRYYDEAIDYIVWDADMKNSEEDGFLLFANETDKIVCRIGNSSYFMGVENNSHEGGLLIRRDRKSNVIGEVIDEDVLYEEYGIKIIGWKAAEPIENSFDDLPGYRENND